MGKDLAHRRCDAGETFVRVSEHELGVFHWIMVMKFGLLVQAVLYEMTDCYLETIFW